MAQNVTIMGASYSAVPAVTLPKTGGGTARFDDASVTTATANDVASGKIFLASNGTITTGTASGGIDAPTFTVIWDNNWSAPISATCDKTYAECKNYYDSGIAFFASTIDTDQSHSDQYMAAAVCLGISYGATDELIKYSVYTGSVPYYDILMYSNGTITITYPSAYKQTLNITQNGTIRNYDYFYDPIIVNVPSSGETTFVVTMSWDSSYGSNGAWVPDKTWAQISAAATAGKTIVAEIDNTGSYANSSQICDDSSVITRYGQYIYTITSDYGNYIEYMKYIYNSLGEAYLDDYYVAYSTSDATATASDVANGKTFYGSNGKGTGSLSFVTYYTGSSTPASSLGSNGDIYLKTV